MFTLSYFFCKHLTCLIFCSIFFFFNDTATTEIYTLSLHDALPIFLSGQKGLTLRFLFSYASPHYESSESEKRKDRKSTRLNSSHANISYAVFCLKKKQCERRV